MGAVADVAAEPEPVPVATVAPIAVGCKHHLYAVGSPVEGWQIFNCRNCDHTEQRQNYSTQEQWAANRPPIVSRGRDVTDAAPLNDGWD